MALTEKDLNRIADAVLQRIEERLFIEDLADAVLKKTSLELKTMQNALEQNPYHNPSGNNSATPIALSEKEKKSLADASLIRDEMIATSEPISSSSSTTKRESSKDVSTNT
ncbi:hypothetical protein J7K50_01315 [bacterium]|nr:hypothetical protein [bacterium]